MNDIEVESANLDTFLKEEFDEMTFDLKAKFMYTFKEIGYYWLNEKLLQNIPSFEQMLSPFYEIFWVYHYLQNK